jgi:V8-like Glu-specific endopeptidase
MQPFRKTLIFLCAALLTIACGGASKEPTAAPAVDEQAAARAEEQPTAAMTAEEQFRRRYSNPGGMWMPSQMTLPEHRENFEKMGVSMAAERLSDPLADPLAAIVSLGGCSASFVSPDGLIVTNHHCVQGALQQNSNEKQNLVENGFLAEDRASELSAGPANRVIVAKAFKDVTKEMRGGLDKIGDTIKRKEESEKRQKALLAECEKDRPGVRCSVSSFFSGAQYKLIEYLEIRDVRLVYAPHRSVGNFGGEIDNWAWPRHTGDFAFLRAYVGPDGKPADFSKDNVPYKPANHLKVSTTGVKQGDFVMVVGYPGRTERTATAAEIRHDVEWFYPYLIEYLKERYQLTERLLTSDDKNTAIKAGVAKQFAQNGLEKFQGVLNGLTKGDLLERKADLDASIKAWAREPGREAIRADIEKMEKIQAEARLSERADFDRNLAFNGSRLLSNTLQLVRMAEERPKKDADRKPGFQDRDMTNMVAQQMAFARAYDRTLDRELFKLSLVRAAKLPEADRPWLKLLLGMKKGKTIDEAAIDAALAKMYDRTKLEDEALRIDLLKKGTVAKLRASKDPFIKAAIAVWPTYKAEEKKSDARQGDLLLVTPAYATAMREVLGGFLSPDANSTLRITYGTVKSFAPDSAEEVDWPFTTGAQILVKDKGKDPFDSPKKVLEALKAKRYGPYAQAALNGELPVDFLSDLDITGGNSGSATLNDKGELVGLAFDGTTEGVASDVVFNGESTRTIHVDARYMLWMMDAIDGADRILEELGVTPLL